MRPLLLEYGNEGQVEFAQEYLLFLQRLCCCRALYDKVDHEIANTLTLFSWQDLPTGVAASHNQYLILHGGEPSERRIYITYMTWSKTCRPKNLVRGSVDSCKILSAMSHASGSSLNIFNFICASFCCVIYCQYTFLVAWKSSVTEQHTICPLPS